MSPLSPSASRSHLRSRAARFLVAVAAATLVVASVSATMAATSTSLRPLADTWVNAASVSANYGTTTTLRVDGSPRCVAFLRFDLSGTTGTVTRAVLQLYPNSSSSAGLSVHPVSNTTWAEKTTTYSNAPAVGSATVKSGAVRAGQVVNVDVTPFISVHGLVSLAVTANSSTAISLASRESTHPPVLVVTVSDATASPTPAPTAKPTPTPSPSQTPAPTSSPPSSAPPTSANPVRAAFYYPWFPQAWTQQGIYPFTHYHPSAGFYDGASQSVVAGQIKAMQYGRISVGIASWWGQGSQTDSKIPVLLSAASGTGFGWAIYYEPEGSGDPSVSQISADLAYINSRYGSNAAFYRVNGRPVIFVYAQPSDGCGMADRWAQANASHADYVVLKVFPGYASCASQPDQWHQYAPAVAEDHQAGHSFTISPGFWLATSSTARLGRDLTRWQQEVRDMVASGEPWQLVTTFNEWGEGTSVESATEWASASGYGTYLDALHNN
jgi:hypothetical protein